MEKKIAIQREARALVLIVAPGVPFAFIVDQMHQRVHTYEGRPCLKDRNRGGYTLTPYDYLAHPECARLRRLVKAGWRGLRGQKC